MEFSGTFGTIFGYIVSTPHADSKRHFDFSLHDAL